MVIEDLALLFVRGLGSRGIVHLIEMYGSAEEIYNTPLDLLIEEAGLRRDIAERIVAKEGMRDAEAEVRYCSAKKICAIAATDADYPEPLRETSDRPHVIFVKGNVDALHMRTLSVVGTRNATPTGILTTDKLIGDLAPLVPDLCIVSGLAYGIDGASHRAALSHNVATVAVLADVLPNISPAAHRNIADHILRSGGALVSELHSQTKQNGQLYIARNRIIAGLSMGTLVVESPASGGSIATADIVDGYNRTLMAVPGRVNDTNSFGTNNLIRTGKARLVMTARDIIEDLGWSVKEQKAEEVTEECPNNLTPDEQRVYDALRDHQSLDMPGLSAATGLTLGELTLLIMDLEMRGIINILQGNACELNRK
jgi:DNA processing protein